MVAFNCRDCPRSFKSIAALSSHCIAKSHALFACSHCQQLFASDSELEQHGRDCSESESSEDDSYDGEPYCEGCNRWFTDVDTLYRHLALDPKHNWCFICSRDWSSASALRCHLSSLAHAKPIFECPFCTRMFKAPSCVAQHVESGIHKINRHQVTSAVKQLEVVPNICINQSPPPLPPTSVSTYFATGQTFNGTGYECFLCHTAFRALPSLNAHLNSPAHDADEFRCPKCRGEFTVISALVQHLESGTCGLARIKDVEGYFDTLTASFSRLLRA